ATGGMLHGDQAPQAEIGLTVEKAAGGMMLPDVAPRADGRLDVEWRAVEAVLAQSADVPATRRRIRVLHLITALERGGAENHLLALLGHADRSGFAFETAVLSGEGELVAALR